MTEPISFEELEQQIEALLEAETTDFFELSEMLCLNPKKDFAGADLSGVDLSGKDLSCANFTGANLQGANLSHTNLEGADFTDADLSSPLLIDATNNRLHYLSNLDLALDRARAIARAIDFDSAINLYRARALNSILAFDNAIVRAIARAIISDRTISPEESLTLALKAYLKSTYNSALESYRTLEIYRTLDRVRARARALNFNNIVAILDCLQHQYLGATFRSANLQNTCWDGAQLDGALMINCQGLTPEDIADLKARGVIFDDAPGERSPVTSPRSPVPV